MRLRFLNWTKYLFHFLSAELIFFHTQPQAKYFFHFLKRHILTRKTLLDRCHLSLYQGQPQLPGIGGSRGKIYMNMGVLGARPCKSLEFFKSIWRGLMTPLTLPLCTPLTRPLSFCMTMSDIKHDYGTSSSPTLTECQSTPQSWIPN